MRVHREPETAPEVEHSPGIENRNLTRPAEANEPHRSHEYRRRTFPLEVILAVLLTVPGPRSLTRAEIARRRRPPTPQVRRITGPAPTGRPSPRVGVLPPLAA